MRKYIISVLAFSFLFVNILHAKVLNKTIAVVGDDTILQSEFEKISKPILAEYERMNPQLFATEKDEIKKEILNSMIEKKVVLQEAKKNKIRASERKIEKWIDKIKSQFKSDKEFNNQLESENIDMKTFRANIADQIIMSELVEKEVKAKVAIPTDKEVEKYYNENEDKMVDPERVRARHILIKVLPDASQKEKDTARKKIKKLFQRVNKGENFVKLAREHSDDTLSAERGGDLGFFFRGQMVPEFEKAAFSLNVGEVSDIVETQFGFHIIRCEEKKIAEKKAFKEVKDYLKELLFKESAEKEYIKWLDNLKSKVNITINEI